MSAGCGFGWLLWQRSRFWGLRSRWTIPLSLSAFSAAATHHHHYHALTRNLSNHTACSPTPAAAVHFTSDCGSFCNCVTLTFVLLTSGSMHAKWLPQSMCVSSLVLIAQAIFLLEHGHTHTHRQTHPPTHSHRCHWPAYPNRQLRRHEQLHHSNNDHRWILKDFCLSRQVFR